MKMKICFVAMMFAFISCVACENIPSDDQVITMINKLDEEQTLPLFGGLSLEKVDNSGDISPRSESLTDRIIRYFQSHKVNFELSEARTNVGGKIKPVIVKKVKKARGKLKKLMLPILLALKFKTAVILPIAFTILSLISLKALKVGLVALILAASSFVKEFFAKKQEKITTAYISANPSNSGFNAEIVSDWNRNGAPAGDLAYNAYNNNNYQTLPQNV